MLPRRGFLQQYASVFSICARVADIVSVFLAGWLAYFIRFNRLIISTRYLGVVLLGAIFLVFIFSWLGLYDSWRGRSLSSQLKRLVVGWFFVVLILILFSIGLKTTVIYSRLWMSYWVILALLILIILRLVIFFFLRQLRKHGWNQRRVVIIGDAELAIQLESNLQQAAWTGLNIVELVALNVASVSEYQDKNISIVAKPDDLYANIQANKADEIWITLSIEHEQEIEAILYELRHSTAPIRFVPDVRQFALFKHPIDQIAGMPVIEITSIPLMGFSKIIKACEDYILGTIFLLISAPIMLIVALAVKLTSKGPVLFKQLRHGCDGRLINVYKFRTMVVHKEEVGKVTQATKDDKRVTKIGKFLRQTSLDELPQLINVLQGRMSIVGPRPHAVEHNELYKDLVSSYMQRHKVKPGITGWAQVNGLRGETDTVEKMQKRVEYDLYYIENWSLWLDLKIIFLTVFKSFKGENAY